MGQSGPHPDGRASRRPTLSRTQQDIVTAVGTEPESSIRRVADELDMNHSTVQYNIRVLADRGIVRTRRVGRELRLFTGQKSRLGRLAPIMRNPKRGLVLEYLADNRVGNISINRIATDLGLSFGLVKRTLVRLADIGVLDLERVRGRYRIDVVADLADLLEELQEAPPRHDHE